MIQEYKTLRDEIKGNAQRVSQIIAVSISSTALLLGYGIETRNWIVLLSPFATLLPAVWFIGSQLESTVRAASYIKICIEPQTKDLRWENRLDKFRLEANSCKNMYTFSITYLFRFLGFVCLFFSWMFMLTSDFNQTNIVVLVLVSVTLILVLMCLTKDLGRYFEQGFNSSYCRKWEELLKEEKSD